MSSDEHSAPIRCLNMVSPELFDEVKELPDEDAARQFGQLIGLDDLKSVLVKQARLLLVPELSRGVEQEAPRHRFAPCW